jgi:hypothetical protein
MSDPSKVLDELERLSKAATPGPWRWWTSNSWRRLSSDPSGKDGDVLCPDKHPIDGHPDCCIKQEDMAHIAAANPETVLALVELARAVIAERSASRHFGKVIGNPDAAYLARDKLLAETERVNAALKKLGGIGG